MSYENQSLPFDSFSQLFFETPHKSLKFQEKITATADKWYTKYASVVKKSLGNAFSSKLDTYISKKFALIPTMEKPHRDSGLSKQQRIIEEKRLKTKVLGWKPARSQARYLANLNNLQEGKLILLGGNTRNYNFTVQDEILGYHWNNQSCTLHPIVMYMNTGGKLASHSLCILSDHLEHDVSLL